MRLRSTIYKIVPSKEETQPPALRRKKTYRSSYPEISNYLLNAQSNKAPQNPNHQTTKISKFYPPKKPCQQPRCQRMALCPSTALEACRNQAVGGIIGISGRILTGNDGLPIEIKWNIGGGSWTCSIFFSLNHGFYYGENMRCSYPRVKRTQIALPSTITPDDFSNHWSSIASQQKSMVINGCFFQQWHSESSPPANPTATVGVTPSHSRNLQLPGAARRARISTRRPGECWPGFSLISLLGFICRYMW